METVRATARPDFRATGITHGRRHSARERAASRHVPADPRRPTPLALGRTQPTDLLAGLSDAERDELDAIGHRRTVRRNTLIYSQGDPPGSTYIVERGMVRTFRVSRDGREFTIGFWPRHEIIGGPDIFTGEPRMLSAESVTQSVLLGFTSGELEYLIGRMPRFACNLVAALSFKSRWMMHVSTILGTRSVPQRVVHALLLQADISGERTEDGHRLIGHLSHSDVAMLVGASRQWVTQALADLERRGLISYGSRRIVLVDEPALHRLADM